MFKVLLLSALLGLAAAGVSRHSAPHRHVDHPVVHHQPVSHHGGGHASSDDAHAEVHEWVSDVRADGFDSKLETTNHISQSASGDEHGNIHGSFSWISPEGEHVDIKYVADEHGYQPVGSWIPTPPPTPEAIVRSLAWIAAHPSHEEQHGHGHHGHH